MTNPTSKWHNRIVYLQSCWNWALITGILFLLILYLFVQDRYWWSEYLSIWPSPLWLFALIPAGLIGWSRRKWKLSIAAVIAIFIFLGITVEWSPVLRRPQIGKSAELRIVSWNDSDASHAVIEQVYRDLKTDLLFVQESPDSPTTPSMGLYWYDAGDCAILSRWPMTPVESRSVGPWSNPQLMRLELPTSKTVLIANVRLMLPSLVLNPLTAPARERLKRDNATRRKQFENLAQLITEKSGEADHVLLAGDFNTPAGVSSLRPLRRLLRDVWPEAGSGWGATVLSSFPVARIDQCWVSQNVQVIQATVSKAYYASDHRPLIVDLAFR